MRMFQPSFNISLVGMVGIQEVRGELSNAALGDPATQ